MPSPKRFRVGTLDVSEEYDEETYLSHVKQMVQEVEIKEPSITHMQTLLKGTFNCKRQWIQQLPPRECKTNFGHVSMLQRPCLVSMMTLAVLKALESETAYRKGKGQKTKRIIKLEDDGKLGRLLSSAPPESAPKLVAIEKDERFVNMAIVCDGTHILLETVDSIEAIAVLIGLYYLADLDYPKAYSQVLGFLQQTVLQQQFDGHKSYGFIQYLKRVNTEMEKKENKPM